MRLIIGGCLKVVIIYRKDFYGLSKCSLKYLCYLIFCLIRGTSLYYCA